MSADLLPILATVISAAVALFLALGGLTLALWRDMGGRVDRLTERVDTLTDRVADLGERVARLEVGGGS